MKSSKLFSLFSNAALVLAIVLGFTSPASAAAPPAGQVFATDAACTGQDIQIFFSKMTVYVDGGPTSDTDPGLPDGFYYIKVTDPTLTSLYGTSVGSANPTPIQVSGGKFVQCYQLWAIVFKASDGTPGFDTNPADPQAYRITISQDPNFIGSTTRRDSFKVKGEVVPPARLIVNKFYDANANGINDDNQPITGWKVRIVDGIDFIRYTPVDFLVDPNDYTVTEFTPLETNWMATTPNPAAVTVAAGETKTVEFGNVCFAPGGGRTPGFWSNKNGKALVGSDDLAMLVGLNLRKADGSHFDPANYDAFRTWLLGGSATNMAYMLSVHLAAMQLNVFNGLVNGSAMIYAPGTASANSLGFASISAVMAEANAALGADGYTPSGDPNRALQETLKNALDKANNNVNFLSPTPCPFTFAEETVTASLAAAAQLVIFLPAVIR